MFHTLSLAVLGLIFGHAVCGCEEIVKQGEAWAGDEKFAYWLISMSIDPGGEQEATGCQSSGFYFFLHLLFLCLFSMLQPVKFIMWGQLSIVISVPFLIRPQKGQIQRDRKSVV